MGFRVVVQGREYNREDDCEVVAHQVDDVFVVPVEQGSFGNLEVLAVDTPCQLLE